MPLSGSRTDAGRGKVRWGEESDEGEEALAVVLHRAAPLLTAAGGSADRGEEAAAAALRADANGSRFFRGRRPRGLYTA